MFNISNDNGTICIMSLAQDLLNVCSSRMGTRVRHFHQLHCSHSLVVCTLRVFSVSRKWSQAPRLESQKVSIESCCNRVRQMMITACLFISDPSLGNMESPLSTVEDNQPGQVSAHVFAMDCADDSCLTLVATLCSQFVIDRDRCNFASELSGTSGATNVCFPDSNARTESVQQTNCHLSQTLFP